jgi:hypothetical protein
VNAGAGGLTKRAEVKAVDATSVRQIQNLPALDTSTDEPAGPPERGEEIQSDQPEAAEATRIDRHLAVLANPSAPEGAHRASEDALLEALSGGYEPEVRLRIARGLVGIVDKALNSLLVEHLADIRSEAEELGNEDLVKEADSLLRRLEDSPDRVD